MSEQRIRFRDGGVYEKTMGAWTRLAGQTFLDWLQPDEKQRWIDVGCGNGAFTELIAERCAPLSLHGIDPSAGQIAFAQQRAPGSIAQYQEGDALALPFEDESADVAVMALVIFFVPEPAKGIAEMVRAVRPGGTVTSYSWDILGGGFPVQPIWAGMQAIGAKTPLPPSVEASRWDALEALWTAAGLTDIERREITVEKTFENFEAFWSHLTEFGSAQGLAKLSDAQQKEIKARVEASIPANADGSVTGTARAFAIRGQKPA